MKNSVDKIGHILFLDIETVSEYATFEEMNDRGQSLWKAKMRYKLSEDLTPAQLYKKRAAIHAEFGKIICISVGLVYGKDDNKVKITTFKGEEKDILENFKNLIQANFNDAEKHRFSGHNIKEFDLPYICRRMISTGIEIPEILQLHGKKPWQVIQMLDTMELWKFGDYKNYTSLDLITYALGIDTPKTEIDGSQVGEIYFDIEQDNSIIYQYCERDVLAVIQVIMKLSNRPQIKTENITFSTEYE